MLDPISFNFICQETVFLGSKNSCQFPPTGVGQGVARVQGLEPRHSEPESDVLPLDDTRTLIPWKF